MIKIYLAGPITGLSYDDANDWRDYVTGKLSGIAECISPMRAKGFLKSVGNLGKSGYEANPLSSQKGITTRDRWDVSRCDAVFMFLGDSESVSIGTMIEAGWADAYRKPVILVIGKDFESTPYNHCMLKELSGYIVCGLDEGIQIVEALAY